jgi:hypothetical protein
MQHVQQVTAAAAGSPVQAPHALAVILITAIATILAMGVTAPTRMDATVSVMSRITCAAITLHVHTTRVHVVVWHVHARSALTGITSVVTTQVHVAALWDAHAVVRAVRQLYAPAVQPVTAMTSIPIRVVMARIQVSATVMTMA